MIKVELVHKLINADDAEIKKIDTDQLRTVLGSFRYLVRRLERELNSRTSEEFIAGVSNQEV